MAARPRPARRRSPSGPTRRRPAGRRGGRRGDRRGRKIEEPIDLAFDPDVRVADGEVAATGPGWTIAGRAHAGPHVEPHVLRVRGAGRAVPRRPRHGVEHDGRVAARRRHGAPTSSRCARSPGGPATARTGRPTGRRSPSRSATSRRSSSTGWSGSARCSTPSGRARRDPGHRRPALRRRRRGAAQAGRPIGPRPPRQAGRRRPGPSPTAAPATKPYEPPDPSVCGHRSAVVRGIPARNTRTAEHSDRGGGHVVEDGGQHLVGGQRG